MSHLDSYDVATMLESKTWTFAKTMMASPHSWTGRDKWNSPDSSFIDTVEYMREHGRREAHGSYAPKPYLYLNGYMYWTMGSPLPQTRLINRAYARYRVPYNDIAPMYDTLFGDKKSQDLNRKVFKEIEPKGRILDIGCGTGLAYEWCQYIEPSQYTGIDPSVRMLRRFADKHPEFGPRLRCTTMADFWHKGFDTIMANFGAASYLTKDDVERVRELLNPGGKAYLMFYQEGYEPATYLKSGIDARPLFKPAVNASYQAIAPYAILRMTA